MERCCMNPRQPVATAQMLIRRPVVHAIDSMGGFTIVLAGLKALLEHDVILNLVGDHHPEAVIADAG
jgi:hypothetical protein